MKENRFQDMSEKIQAPDFIVPWLDRFYEPEEQLLLQKSQPLYATETAFKNQNQLSSSASLRLFQRGVFFKQPNGSVTPADFHKRYDIWALFEGFKDVPEQIRAKLNQWEFDAYVHRCRDEVEAIRTTGRLDPSRKQPRYILLKEVPDILAKALHIYLWPCNCRSMMQQCKKPVYTCIRFDNSEGQGYEISREKAMEIICRANKKGLIQSAEIAEDDNGQLSGAICNCCTDCCFPHQVAEKLNARKIWPQSRWVAQWNPLACTFCGLCASRCPFQAFKYDRQKSDKKSRLTFNLDACRGCGLCEETCPGQAIKMGKVR